MNEAQLDVFSGVVKDSLGNLDTICERSSTVMKMNRIDADFAAGPFFLAFCRIYQQRLEEAEELGLRTLELDDRNPNHHLLMKAVYQARGNAEKALHHEARANQLRGGSGP